MKRPFSLPQLRHCFIGASLVCADALNLHTALPTKATKGPRASSASQWHCVFLFLFFSLSRPSRLRASRHHHIEPDQPIIVCKTKLTIPQFTICLSSPSSLAPIAVERLQASLLLLGRPSAGLIQRSRRGIFSISLAVVVILGACACKSVSGLQQQ